MQRILMVYNPNSSNYRRVKSEVLARVNELGGTMVGKYAVTKTSFGDNVTKLKKLVQDGDLVVAAGGDATAAIALNAVMESKKDAALAVLPYGNFNDLARTLGTMKFEDVFVPQKEILKSGEMKKNFKVPLRFDRFYPLELIVDGKFFRFASCYVTIGMTAEAVELFDEPKVRKELQKGRKNSWRSYLYLVKWYFKNRHKKVFVPDFVLNDKKTIKGISDYAAVNGKSMCRVMKGGEDYLKPKVFRSENCRLTSFPRLFVLMTKSILVRTPGMETTGDKLRFIEPATVEAQAEGEYQVFHNVREMEIKKSGRFIKVVRRQR